MFCIVLLVYLHAKIDHLSTSAPQELAKRLGAMPVPSWVSQLQGSKNGGYPKNGWFLMENPSKIPKMIGFEWNIP